MFEIDYENDYLVIDRDANSFDELSWQVQSDLTEWLNHKPDQDDKERLLNLYISGNFIAWDCPKCKKRVFRGEPEDWGYFQGTLNQDFSYFGDPDIYTQEYLMALCDSCRCYSH